MKELPLGKTTELYCGYSHQCWHISGCWDACAFSYCQKLCRSFTVLRPRCYFSLVTYALLMAVIFNGCDLLQRREASQKKKKRLSAIVDYF